MRLLVNSKLGRRLLLLRGVRQGDPLSGFLYIILGELFFKKYTLFILTEQFQTASHTGCNVMPQTWTHLSACVLRSS